MTKAAMLRSPRRAKHRKPDVRKRVKPVLRRTFETDRVAKRSLASLARSSPVHSEIPTIRRTETWDMVVDHIGRGAIHSADYITNWLAMMLHPDVPQDGLLLVGPTNSGKTTFHRAASLLLPPDATWEAERYLSESELSPILANAKLFVLDGNHLEFSSFGSPRLKRKDRYMKWIQCVNADPVPYPRHFTKIECEALNTIIPTHALFARLLDERAEFLKRLSDYIVR